MRLAMSALALSVVFADACVQPNSGSHAAKWCKAADGVSVVVDDMEDGDGNLCPAATGGPGGAWQVVLANPMAAAVTLAPPAGPLAATAPLPAPTPAPSESTRAIELTGTGFTSASNASAILAAQFGTAWNIAGVYSSIQFWAVADRDTWIRVNLAAAEDPASGARWGQPVKLSTTWTQIVVPVSGLTMEFGAAAALDLTTVSALEFRYAFFIQGASGSNTDAGNVGAFDLWIDDVQLTP